MGGQVLGGGVIVLVAVVLWLVYLLPSWQGRHQFNAAERNAVRLNQALRILAETSETPQEVRLELNARTALAQQRLARQAQAEREKADLERARAELSLAKAQARADAAAARDRAAVE
ncbi:large exoprotein, partial [Microbacterium lacticum]|nr:large exoprotein [Microbacterium lacticum]